MEDLIKAVAASVTAVRTYRITRVRQIAVTARLHPTQVAFLRRLDSEVAAPLQNHYAIDMLLDELEVLLSIDFSKRRLA